MYYFSKQNTSLTSLYNEVDKVFIQNDQIGFTFSNNKYIGNVIKNTSILSWKYLYSQKNPHSAYIAMRISSIIIYLIELLLRNDLK